MQKPGTVFVVLVMAGLWVWPVLPASASVEVPQGFELAPDPVAVQPDTDPFLRPQQKRVWTPWPDQIFL